MSSTLPAAGSSTTTGLPQVVLDDLVVRYGPRLVLDGLGLVAGAGERLGVVGENGSGKSTLLRVVAGLVPPEHGVVRVHGAVGLLAQQVDAAAGRTVADLLAEARREIDDLQARRGALETAVGDHPDDAALLEEYGDVLEALEQHEAWTVGSRLDAAVDGLGLASLDRSRPLASLSGGQRHRLALAALLVRHPVVLLLDEPTTHLDDDAVAFLEARLREWSGVVLMVSHDRVLLDAVATSVLDLDPSLDGRRDPVERRLHRVPGRQGRRAGALAAGVPRLAGRARPARRPGPGERAADRARQPEPPRQRQVRPALLRQPGRRRGVAAGEGRAAAARGPRPHQGAETTRTTAVLVVVRAP